MRGRGGWLELTEQPVGIALRIPHYETVTTRLVEGKYFSAVLMWHQRQGALP